MVTAFTGTPKGAHRPPLKSSVLSFLRLDKIVRHKSISLAPYTTRILSGSVSFAMNRRTMNHTTGPWKLQLINQSEKIFSVRRMAKDLLEIKVLDQSEEGRTNLSLISTAPHLSEVCVRIIRTWNERRQISGKSGEELMVFLSAALERTNRPVDF